MAIKTVKPRNFFLSKRRVKYKIILKLIFINFFLPGILLMCIYKLSLKLSLDPAFMENRELRT